VTLAELKLIAAQKPPALEELSNTLVFGEGDPDAKLLVIGEAPGADEDAQGEPFVGRAGQLLDQALGSVGIDRDSIWLTNMVKFRPPGNRNPTQAEIKASEPVLLEEIRLVNPQVIVPLGNVPSQFLLGTKEGITKLQGKWFDWQGTRVFPLFHPAYLLRNPSRTQGSPKWLMWQALKELKSVLDSLGPKQNGLSVSGTQQEGLF
jgi:DNA polymerase